ncbi:hypothetical protein K502DRAFT_361700 [Neoconidiobolus thromboides FSU 785]|nr:hypothetical protein K502DRAFT_361700 [Neoconidiobolus thromboides FSU 785]
MFQRSLTGLSDVEACGKKRNNEGKSTYQRPEDEITDNKNFNIEEVNASFNSQNSSFANSQMKNFLSYNHQLNVSKNSIKPINSNFHFSGTRDSKSTIPNVLKFNGKSYEVNQNADYFNNWESKGFEIVNNSCLDYLSAQAECFKSQESFFPSMVLSGDDTIEKTKLYVNNNHSTSTKLRGNNTCSINTRTYSNNALPTSTISYYNVNTTNTINLYDNNINSTKTISFNNTINQNSIHSSRFSVPISSNHPNHNKTINTIGFDETRPDPYIHRINPNDFENVSRLYQNRLEAYNNTDSRYLSVENTYRTLASSLSIYSTVLEDTNNNTKTDFDKINASLNNLCFGDGSVNNNSSNTNVISSSNNNNHDITSDSNSNNTNGIKAVTSFNKSQGKKLIYQKTKSINNYIAYTILFFVFLLAPFVVFLTIIGHYVKVISREFVIRLYQSYEIQVVVKVFCSIFYSVFEIVFNAIDNVYMELYQLDK